ncbi:hypothetical protein [Aeromicrobium wangtongii]|uniref:hypothetical protein n=1 Tax=Aeromicrobium wangtongii TaxID=2969247 RepID=UPI002016BA7E|nr:hypothetical protein [Aeromicrobium wangtongii]MCL3817530.1 hypothetical protein [Aeromicrobium wangtongii]
MITVGDGFFSVLVTTMFVTLLMIAGGIGVALGLALAACGIYRARCSPLRLPRVDRGHLQNTVHG